MKILVIGSGGREHALAWRLAQGAKVQKVYVAPGNAGTALEDGVENVAISAIPDLIEFVKRENIELTVVGPEAPLAAGVVDDFRKAGLKIFGPTKIAAELEGSKVFTRELLKRYGIPSPSFKVVTSLDEAMHYLAWRGLHVDLPMPALRLHPGLAYRDGGETFGRFPAMLALVTGPDGRGVTLHRTYLQDGRKAPVPSPRKLMPGKPIKGAAIRLHPAGEVLGVAEGIETALAARQLFGVPVWSCISAAGIESFIPPKEVRKIMIFGDNDMSGTGQAAAWALAKRLIVAGLSVEVKLPERIGTDWADEVTL